MCTEEYLFTIQLQTLQHFETTNNGFVHIDFVDSHEQFASRFEEKVNCQ